MVMISIYAELGGNAMSVSRSARPDEIDSLVALSDLTFRKPGQSSMGTAYAMLFSEDNAENLLIMEEDGTPVTLVGLLPVSLSIAGCTIPAVSMGSVCTATAYRGKNFADTLVKQSITKCMDDGAHLLLVSGSRSLYLRNDCLEVGAIKRFTIRSAEELEGLPVPVEAIVRICDEQSDLSAMLRLMESEQVYYQRTEAELEQLIRSAAIISNDNGEQSVLLNYSGSGEAIGYIVLGLLEKGGIRTVEIVEFAGSDEAVAGLLREVWFRYNPDQLHISVTNDRFTFSEKLVSRGCSFKEIPIPGTIRMINFTGLWNSLYPYMEQQIGRDRLSELKLVETNNGWRIVCRGETFTVDHIGATNLVFNGPQLVENGELKKILSEMFPLPFVYTKNLNFV
jgi:predicted N-acetyltransferase YhbS